MFGSTPRKVIALCIPVLFILGGIAWAEEDAGSQTTTVDQENTGDWWTRTSRGLPPRNFSTHIYGNESGVSSDAFHAARNMTWGSNDDIIANYTSGDDTLNYYGNVSLGNFQSVASYVVWEDGGTYKAMNGTTEQVEFSGTDEDAVMQNVLDNTDGIVFVRNGIYTFEQALEVKYNGTSIIGESRENTIFKRCDVIESAVSGSASSGQKDVTVSDASGFEVGQQVYIGEKSSTDDTWEINRIASISSNTITMETNLVNSYSDTNSDYVYTAFHVFEAYDKKEVAFANFYIDGNKANNYQYSQYDTSVTTGWTFRVQNGIHLNNSERCTVSNIHVKNNVGWGGIALSDGTSNSTIKNCWTEYAIRHGIILFNNVENNIVHSCRSNNNGDTGETFPRHNLILEYNAQGTIVHNCHFTNPPSNSNNIYTYDTSMLTINNCIFTTNRTSCHIRMGGPILNEKILISDNIFRNTETNGGRISTLTAVNNLVITDNQFFNPSDATSQDCITITEGGNSILISDNNFINGYRGVYLSGTKNVSIISNDFNNFDYGIQARTSGSTKCNDTVIQSNTIIGNGSYSEYGVMIRDGGDDNIISNNKIINIGSNPAVYTGTDTIRGSINNNHISHCKYGIQIQGGSPEIKHNYIVDITLNEIVNNANPDIAFNEGYTTENSGTFETTGMDGSKVNYTVAHGCDDTPNYPFITPRNETMSNCTYYIDHIDSTNFYIHIREGDGSALDASEIAKFHWEIDSN